MIIDRNEVQRVLAGLRIDSTDFGVGVYHAGIDQTRLFSVRELTAGGFGPHFAALERVGWDSAWYAQEPIFGYYIELVASVPVINPFSGLNNAIGGGPVPQRELDRLVQALGFTAKP